jgi:hypothetical protein
MGAWSLQEIDGHLLDNYLAEDLCHFDGIVIACNIRLTYRTNNDGKMTTSGIYHNDMMGVDAHRK